MPMPYLRFLLDETIEQLLRPPDHNVLQWQSVVGLATEIEATRQQLGVAKQILTFRAVDRSKGIYFARAWPPWAEKGLQMVLQYYQQGPDQTPRQIAHDENRKTLTDILRQWVRAIEADAVPRQEQPQGNNDQPDNWRDPGKDTEDRLAELAKAKPECVDWSTRELGEAVDRAHTTVRDSKWYKMVRENRELVNKSRLKRISDGEYYDEGFQ